MSASDDPFAGITQESITALRQRLSEPALEGLARDVVRRLAGRAQAQAEERESLNHPDASDIAALTRAILSSDAAEATLMMRALQERGLTLDVLYARYLAPAASRLGALWDADEIGFVDVTMGVGRIFGLVRYLRQMLPYPRITRSEPVLFATVPGDQHTVGTEMAVQLFRQHGWDVRHMHGADEAAILAEVAQIGCLVLGLSSSGRSTAEALARLVCAVRLEHPEVHIIVSGRIVTDEPDLVALVHPDSAVTTVEEALATMEALSANGQLGHRAQS